MVLSDKQFYIFPSYNSFPVWVEEWQQLVALTGAKEKPADPPVFELVIAPWSEAMSIIKVDTDFWAVLTGNINLQMGICTKS